MRERQTDREREMKAEREPMKKRFQILTRISSFEKEELILRKVKFWNMPYSDILKTKKVWYKTRKIIGNGQIIKDVKTDRNGKEVRLTNFPNKKFSSTCIYSFTKYTKSM